jgi:hypothetical protein
MTLLRLLPDVIDVRISKRYIEYTRYIAFCGLSAAILDFRHLVKSRSIRNNDIGILGPET